MVVVRALKTIIIDTNTFVQNAAELLEGSSKSRYSVFFKGFRISAGVNRCLLRCLAGRSLDRLDMDDHAAALPPIEMAPRLLLTWFGEWLKSWSLSSSDGTKWWVEAPRPSSSSMSSASLLSKRTVVDPSSSSSFRKGLERKKFIHLYVVGYASVPGNVRTKV